MDLELLDMLEEHIQAYSDLAKINAHKEAFNKLVQDDDSLSSVFLLGSLYGSCHFILESYSSRKPSEKDEAEFIQWLYNHIKGLNLTK